MTANRLQLPLPEHLDQSRITQISTDRRALIETNLDKSGLIWTVRDTKCHKTQQYADNTSQNCPIAPNFAPKQPYGSINPQIAPAGSRITANLPSPSSLGPSTISPPSSVTRATLESRSSTLM